MARGGLTAEGAGTLVLDSQGLSLYLAQDRAVLNLVQVALSRGAHRVVSGVTLLEAHHAKVQEARWNYVLSQLDIRPMTVEWFREATALLGAVGLHGHKYAIDAMVAVTALHQPEPVVMLTSDVDDMSKLCGDRLTYIAL
ncbi:DNA-binding protein [Streptomyces vinaceus]|uniref:DNA-binding protein n=1 Tax=Streptomyces vinaceus TaxID=1960 RepID=UPI0035D6A265